MFRLTQMSRAHFEMGMEVYGEPADLACQLNCVQSRRSANGRLNNDFDTGLVKFTTRSK